MDLTNLSLAALIAQASSIAVNKKRVLVAVMSPPEVGSPSIWTVRVAEHKTVTGPTLQEALIKLVYPELGEADPAPTPDPVPEPTIVDEPWTPPAHDGCACECHIPGVVVLHCFPCCGPGAVDLSDS